jgi:large subunit ribosomal protein L24
MNRLKSHVNKGDIVRVISGNHRGAEGKILQVIRGKDQVLIEGVRMVKKHTRKSQDHPNGAIVEREGPIHLSNVKRIEAAEKNKETAKAKAKPKAK